MSPRSKSIAPPPGSVDVGIVAALPIELAPFLPRLSSVRKYSAGGRAVVEGEIAGKLVAVAIGGPGRAAATDSARRLVAGHRPRWIVSAGFAGALDPGLARREVLFPDEIVGPDGASIRVALAIDPAGDGPAIRTGRLATVEEVVRTPADRAELRARTGAIAVDMETSAVASFCAEAGRRFLAVRVVSDSAEDVIPPEALALVGPTGSYRVGAALGAIWHRPSSLKDLLRLREHALAAARRLADVLIWTIGNLD